MTRVLHASDCDGPDAPWCAPGCSGPLVTLAEASLLAGRAPRLVRRHCKAVAYGELGRGLYDLRSVLAAFRDLPRRQRRGAA